MPDYNSINSITLPYSLEAEQAVLGAVLNDPECIEKILPILKAEYFYLPAHKTIYSSMIAMYTGSKAKIDPVVIADALVKGGDYDDVGGREYLLALKDSVPSAANVETYAQIVSEQYLIRALITASQDIIARATDSVGDKDRILEANKLLDYAEQKIYDIRKGKDLNGPRKLSDVIINDVYDRLGKITGEDKEKYKAIPTGFGMLDKYIAGLNKSEFILIGARPAMGKTSFALNLAQNVVNIGKKCLFFSLEMTKEELAERILSANSGVPSNKLRTGELTADEWTRLGNAAGRLESLELWIDDSSTVTVPDIKSITKRMKDVDVIFIDYLGLITSAVRKENRVQEVSEITKGLKMMAKDLNIPVVCCAQLNRGTDSRGKSHKPQLSDLRESGSIEQDTDIVMFLYRHDYYKNDNAEDADDQENEDPNATELIVAKNRHGATGSVFMTFDKEFTRFRSIETNYDKQ